ncbi:seizure protein 6 [Grus japonensis]|uniref:Seizure protein 6 n=1 Tax=Grus japonensis TaxID=30415 RepID=A0ABC9XXA9_GRUJA
MRKKGRKEEPGGCAHARLYKLKGLPLTDPAAPSPPPPPPTEAPPAPPSTFGDPRAPCNVTLGGPEGWLEAPGGVPGGPGGLDCTYGIRANPGFGLELQVQQLNLTPGELLTLQDSGSGVPPDSEGPPLVAGQVLRVPSGRLRLRFRSPRPAAPGAFRLRYRGFRPGCSCPPGPSPLRCLRRDRPCRAGCGGAVTNATRGRLETPEGGGRGLANLSCHWLLEAPPGHRLHLTFERLALDEDADRFSIRGGPDPRSPLLFDSDLDDVPRGGVLSPARTLLLQLLSEGPRQGPPLLALRYDAFPAGGCPPPRLPHGGFLSTDPRFSPGTLVTFSCRPGYALGGGPPTLRCLGAPPLPRWNDTQPLCRALCGAELSEAVGVVKAPPPPPPGRPSPPQDCVWSIRLAEEKRVLVHVQSLALRPNSSLTLLDGEEVTGRVLGEFGGARPPLTLLSSGATVTLRYRAQGGAPQNLPEPSGAPRDDEPFVIRYEGVPRNDTCPELPGVPFSRLAASRPLALRGTVLTFQCRPGYRLRGPDLLTCQWDLSWSAPPPACQRVKYEPCLNPGVPANGYQTLYKHHYQAGESLRFFCYEGYELLGEVTITCLPGHPSRWTSQPPLCKGRDLQVIFGIVSGAVVGRLDGLC